jgi:large subunit ribosomal protein L6
MEVVARLVGQAIPRSARSSTRSTRSLCSSSVLRSHIGSEPILIPESVTCKLGNAQPQRVEISGQRGASSIVLPAGISAQLRSTEGGTPDAPLFALEVSCQDTGSSKFRSNWGLARTKLNNTIVGLTEGFSLPVKLVGVGYRATLEAVAVGTCIPSPEPADCQ